VEEGPSQWRVPHQEQDTPKRFSTWITGSQPNKYTQVAVLRMDPGSSAFLTPGSEIRDGLKITIRFQDKQPGSYFRELRKNFFLVKILKFFDVDPGWKYILFGLIIPDP
jgi:hypothetical protein